MPFTDIFSDLLSSLSFAEAHAEAPPAEEDSEDQGEEESKDDEGEKEEGGNEEGGDDEGGEDEEEEEEEEEEPVDIKPQLEEGTISLILSTPEESPYFLPVAPIGSGNFPGCEGQAGCPGPTAYRHR